MNLSLLAGGPNGPVPALVLEVFLKLPSKSAGLGSVGWSRWEWVAKQGGVDSLLSEDAKKVCSRFCLLANTKQASGTADCLNLGQKERVKEARKDEVCSQKASPHPSTLIISWPPVHERDV